MLNTLVVVCIRDQAANLRGFMNAVKRISELLFSNAGANTETARESGKPQ